MSPLVPDGDGLSNCTLFFLLTELLQLEPAAALSTEVATETPTVAIQIDSTSLETVIQSAVQALVSACLKLLVLVSVFRRGGGASRKLQVRGHKRTSEYME